MEVHEVYDENAKIESHTVKKQKWPSGSRTDHLGTRGGEARKVSTVYGCGWPSKIELAPRRNEEGVQVKDNISVIDDYNFNFV